MKKNTKQKRLINADDDLIKIVSTIIKNLDILNIKSDLLDGSIQKISNPLEKINADEKTIDNKSIYEI